MARPIMLSAARPITAVRWTVPVSVGLHGLLLLLAVLLMAPRALPVPPERPIAVELISSEAMQPEPAAPLPLTVPAPSPEPAAIPLVAATSPVTEPAPAPVAGTPGMKQASQFYASGILADPANAELRDNFPLLAGSEQLIQLCNIEALEQLRDEPGTGEPDALVGYAFGDMQVTGGRLEAEFGAFRRDGQWYHLRYRCTVGSDLRSVSAFEYQVGALVPPSEWEEHFLNGDDEGFD